MTTPDAPAGIPAEIEYLNPLTGELCLFETAGHITALKGRGGKPYLTVHGRIVWLRQMAPEAHVMTELIEHSQNHAIFKATVSLDFSGQHATATAYGSETQADFGDFLEKAESKAIGRALINLGLIAGAEGFDEPSPTSRRREKSSDPDVSARAEPGRPPKDTDPISPTVKKFIIDSARTLGVWPHGVMAAMDEEFGATAPSGQPWNTNPDYRMNQITAEQARWLQVELAEIQKNKAAGKGPQETKG